MLRRLVWPALAAALLAAFAVWAVTAAPSTHDPLSSAANPPNDPLYPQQWGLQGAFGIQATDAWAVTTGGDGVITIALLDSGFDETHPDLQGRWENAYNYLETGWPSQDDWTDNYGTALAGVVGATGNNSTGVAGTSWRPKLMPLRVVSRRTSGDGAGLPQRTFNTASIIAQALDYATEKGARIVVFGFSLGNLSETDQTTIRDAIRRNQDSATGRNLVIVAPVGEIYPGQNPVPIPYPAALDGDGVSVIGVTGILTTGLALQSSGGQLIVPTGSYVDLAAPGDMVITTSRGPGSSPVHGYETLRYGTSYAAGYVAGVAALALSVNPTMAPEQALQTLSQSARDLGAAGRDDVYGAGLVNAGQAVLRTRHFLNLTPNTVRLARHVGATATITNPYTLGASWTLVSAPPWLTVSTPTNTGGGSVAQITLSQDPGCLDSGGGTVVFRSTLPQSFNTQEIRVEVANVGPCRRLFLPYLARACTTPTNCAIGN